METAAEHAALKARWLAAVQALKAIPAAAANRSISKRALHSMAAQAEVDCTCTEVKHSHEQIHLAREMELPQPVLEMLVHKLKV